MSIVGQVAFWLFVVAWMWFFGFLITKAIDTHSRPPKSIRPMSPSLAEEIDRLEGELGIGQDSDPRLAKDSTGQYVSAVKWAMSKAPEPEQHISIIDAVSGYQYGSMNELWRARCSVPGCGQESIHTTQEQANAAGFWHLRDRA